MRRSAESERLAPPVATSLRILQSLNWSAIDRKHTPESGRLSKQDDMSPARHLVLSPKRQPHRCTRRTPYLSHPSHAPRYRNMRQRSPGVLPTRNLRCPHVVRYHRKQLRSASRRISGRRVRHQQQVPRNLRRHNVHSYRRRVIRLLHRSQNRSPIAPQHLALPVHHHLRRVRTIKAKVRSIPVLPRRIHV